MAIVGDKREIVRVYINDFFCNVSKVVFFQLIRDTASFISFEGFYFIFKPLILFVHQTQKHKNSIPKIL